MVRQSSGLELIQRVSVALQQSLSWGRVNEGSCRQQNPEPLDYTGLVGVLQAVALVAFMTGVLSSLAATVHMLVLQMFTRDAHLPPCAPDQRVCAETYNLLLVL